MSNRLSDIEQQLKRAETELSAARQAGDQQQIASAEAKIAQLRAQRQTELAAIEQERKVMDKARKQEKKGHLTHGGLVPAVIFPVNREGVQSAVGASVEPVYFSFNPTDYTITHTARYTGQGLDANKNYHLEYDAEAEPRKLSMSSIWFDTTDTGDDVRKETDKLFAYVEVSSGGGDFSKTDTLSQKPPYAAFEWGKFRFLAVVQSVAVEFVHFKPDGTPLRAKATVSFMEFKHRKLYARQNPTSGSNTHNGVWHVVAHERLDTIAAQVYGDATQWRYIAEHNQITDPLAIYPGQTLTIPSLWDV
jgi:nucleoid-associated protein YgaU